MVVYHQDGINSASGKISHQQAIKYLLQFTFSKQMEICFIRQSF